MIALHLPADRSSARSLVLLLHVVLVLLLSSSCNHREFLYEAPAKRVPVIVEFDWTDDPTAAPGGMTVYFFRTGSKSSTPVAYDFKGRDGGAVSLIPGIYSAICHNNDSDRHGFTTQDSYDEFGIRLIDHRNAGNLHNNASSIYPRDLNERIAHFPDSMWVAAIPVFEIEASEPGVAPRQTQVISFRMQTVVHHYTFLIHNPLNFNKSISVSATLSGMAATIHPGRGVTGDETVTHLFSMEPTPDGGLFGEILTFGHCGGGDLGTRADGSDAYDDDSKPHILLVQALLNDGRTWTSSHDVTDQIHGSRVADCVIRLDSIAFPASTASGGGFSPSVGGWTGSQENVGM